MTPSEELQSPSPKRSIKPSPELQSSDHWVDRIAIFWLKFSRFGWDIAGLLLLVFAALTLLGLARLTEGSFISPWAMFIKKWLGLGSYLIVAVAVILGIYIFWRRYTGGPWLRLRQVLALEGLFFTILMFLSELGGNSLTRAEGGMDGGLVGWGLAHLVEIAIPFPFSAILILILILFFIIIGFGLLFPLIEGFENWLLREEASSITEKVIEPESSDVDSAPVTQSSSVKKTKERIPDTRGLSLAKPQKRKDNLPPLNLLHQDQLGQTTHPEQENIHQIASLLEKTLAEFGIPARVVGFRVGPVVTQYAVEPGYVEREGPDGTTIRQKVRVSQISALSRDLARALSAERLRIEAPVPGRSFVGVEIPNSKSATVRLRSILESDTFLGVGTPLAIALGRDVSGQPIVADLARMPHLLVAGTTGSGKSICIQALTLCLVMNNTPDELRLVMLDPKMVELIRFNGLPHLLGKVEFAPERMIGVLRWALMEMDSRYKLLEAARARDLEAYNRRAAQKKQQPLPHIVLMVDELADLMMSAPDQTEQCVVRLAQLARATGIHLVVATQRPSTDVVTGLIKANFPARIAFNVASSIDSRVILDTNGAETLLGRGDMLFLNPEVGSTVRAQGVIVTDQEIQKIITYWQKAVPHPAIEPPWEALLKEEEAGADIILPKAIEVVRREQRASTSLLQRRLRIGYPRAARLIDEMEEQGIIGPPQPGGRDREVLIPAEDDEIGSEENQEE